MIEKGIGRNPGGKGCRLSRLKQIVEDLIERHGPDARFHLKLDEGTVWFDVEVEA